MSAIKRAFFGKRSTQPFFRRLFALSLEGMNIGTGGGDISRTGEAFAIRYCLKALNGVKDPIVFDVGAQGGDYIREVLAATAITQGGGAKAAAVAGVSIFAFEPNSKDFAALKDTFADVKLYNIALSDSIGRMTLHSNGANGLSSFYAADAGAEAGKQSVSEEVSVETIDRFCDRQAIERIDLLKLDVEGHELACLKGARIMLPRIQHIQFEMSIRSRDARTYFKDIFDYLGGDYRIYRILKDGLVEIKTPDKISELLFTTNYLAIRK